MAFKKFGDDFARRQLDEIGLSELQEYQAFLLKGLTPQTVTRHFSPIKNLFKCSKKWGRINNNPTEGLEQLKPLRRRAIRILSLDEMQVVLRGAKGWVCSTLLFIIATGVRRDQCGLSEVWCAGFGRGVRPAGGCGGT